MPDRAGPCRTAPDSLLTSHIAVIREYGEERKNSDEDDVEDEEVFGVGIGRQDAPDGGGIEVDAVEGLGDVAMRRRRERVVEEDRQQKRRLEEKGNDATKHVHPPAGEDRRPGD